MNPKRGLIALFVLMFFLSGIGLSLLISDDQKDLSSRAATSVPGSLRKALPQEKYLTQSNLWSVIMDGVSIEAQYNPILWFPPKNQDMVFLHQNLPVSVRLLNEPISLDRLKTILGSDFVFKKNLGSKEKFYDWSRERYIFSFFNQEKFVEIWSNQYQLSLVIVANSDENFADVQDLVSQIVINPVGKVKGAATLDESARLAALIRPSVVMILNNYCAQVSYNAKSYPFCLGQVGSGFFINKDGYIATNGHVVTSTPDTTLFYAVDSGALDNFLTDFLQNYLALQKSLPVERTLVDQKVKEAHANKETIYQMAALVQDLFKKDMIKINNSESHYYVQLANTPIQISKTGVNSATDILPATFIDADYAEPDPNLGFTTSDVAIIKVNGSNFPALPLGKMEDVPVGSEILVVGYPGVVMGSNSLLLDTSANTQPTFTRGVVSSFKQAKGNKKNLIQTDASINHGNSGGPAVSSSGQVIGIATYGLVPDSGGGNYNFLRDIADLKDLMAKNKIISDTGPTYTTWKSGLDNYWISYFKYSAGDFEKVATLYPNHPTVKSYLSDADSKINTPDDRTPRLTRSVRRIYINITGAVMTLSIFMIVVLTISNYIDSKRRRAGVVVPQRNLPPRPIQTF